MKKEEFMGGCHMNLNKQVNLYSIDTGYFYTDEEWVLHQEIQERKLLNKLSLKVKYKQKEKEINLHNKRITECELYIRGVDKYLSLKFELDGLYAFRKAMKSENKHYKTHAENATYIRNEENIKTIRKLYLESKELIESMGLLRVRDTEEYEVYDENNKEIGKLKKEIRTQFEKNKDIKRTITSKLKTKDIICVFDNSLTRTIGAKINELTEDIMIIRTYYYELLKSIILKGYVYNGEKYVCWSASAGQIRNKKCVFIKEETLKTYYNSIYCGLTLEKINRERVKFVEGVRIVEKGCNKNKFLAYSSLVATASEKWDDFDIDRAIVVDDFEMVVNGLVDYIDYNKYDEKGLWSIERKQMDITIPTMDGCGISLNYTGMFRAPWVKGLLVKFPFVSFIKEARKIEKEKNPDLIITDIGKVLDIYGDEYDILKDGIKYIFTKSQFKMWKYYDNWKEYKDNFKTYNCEACKCNEEIDEVNDAKISYQPLQSLYDMTDKELTELLKQTNSDIEDIGDERNRILKILGATSKNLKKTYFQQALEIYPELLNDIYSKEVLKETKNSIVNNAKYGKVKVNGKYFFLIPDIYAFAQWLFLHDENPSGLLKDGEISCKAFENGVKLDIVRNPHLNFSHCVTENVLNESTNEWYKSNGIYTSCHSLYSLELMCDWDGDQGLIIQNPEIVNTATRIRQKHDIVPLYYKLQKAKDNEITNESIYQGMIDAYSGGNIGEVSNSICKIWNNGFIGDDELRAIAYLTLWNNAVIDYAKCLWFPDKSEEMKKFLKQYTNKKLPAFFQYIKQKNKLPEQLEIPNGSIVNRFRGEVKNPKTTFKATNCGVFNYEILISNKNIKTNSILSKAIIKTFSYWNRNKKYIKKQDTDNKHSYVNQFIREECLKQCGDVDYVVDTLVKYFYNDKESKRKRTLWDVFGDVIVENIKSNIEDNSILCDICGSRFIKNNNKQRYCSDECLKKAKNSLNKGYYNQKLGK